MPNALLKLLVKDKPLYSGKVPVSTMANKERKMMLQQMRDRLAAENPEERERRLQQTSTNQHARLAVKTPAERETTLQQRSTNRRERLAVETPEERDLRLECYSTRCREQQPIYSHKCFNSVPFKAKMQKFYTNMATLDTPACSTCSERFPGSPSPKA